jgi:hypothetical protein
MVRVEQVENVRADFTFQKFSFFFSAVLASKVLALDLFRFGPFTGRWTSPPWMMSKSAETSHYVMGRATEKDNNDRNGTNRSMVTVQYRLP